jgi:hypothetical protein
MLSLTVSILETIVVKTTVFAISQAINLASYGTYAVYNWYNPTISPTDRLQTEVKLLRDEIFELRQLNHDQKVIILE